MIQINTAGLPGQISPVMKAASSQPASTAFNKALEAQFQVPASMDVMFEEAAGTYGIPSVVLKAVAKAESNFNPKAQSHCGAMGVMQLMPATAKSLDVTDPWDARQNIMGGSKYLRDMLDRYDGDLKLALAAYNAGSGNVAKYGGVPPFQETQNYVKKIFGYLQQPEISLELPKMKPTPSYSWNSDRIRPSPAGLREAFTSGSGNGTDPYRLLDQVQDFSNFSEDDYIMFLELIRLRMNSSLMKPVI